MAIDHEPMVPEPKLNIVEQPCQELDGSGLLSVSKTVMLWVKDAVKQWSVVQRRAQSSN